MARARELVMLIAELVGYKGKIVWGTSKPDGQPRRCLETRRAREEFGFEPKTDLKEGLNRTTNWYLGTRVVAEAKNKLHTY